MSYDKILSVPCIELHNVNKTYKTKNEKLHTLKNINLKVMQGDCISITGPSGSGKSTLLALIAGLDIADPHSEILLYNKNICEMKKDELSLHRAKHIGFIFQDFQLLESMTALENVTLPLEIRGVQNAKALGIKALENVQMHKRLHHFPNQLSGGEMQRVAIARASIHNPGILLADEPTGNLDTKNTAKIMKLLLQKGKQNTIIIVTHNEKLAKLTNQEIQLRDGKIIKILRHRKKKY